MMNDQTLVLMSIVYQMLEKDPNIDGFNPFVQEYLEGLAEELNEMTVTSKKPSIKIQEDDIVDDLMHTPSIIKSF